jgi:hypothetical protein
MDRQIVYPSSIPLDTDILNIQRNTMVALGFLAQATLGTATVADGLACTPQTVPNLTFNVGPGSIISLATVDGNPFGSLPSDNSDPLVKMGINLTSTLFTVTAPTTTGQSINYLVQGAFQESDATPIVLPYYNSASPSVPYSGPANSGLAQNTQRLHRVNLLPLKAGAPGATGSQVTPAPDAGFVGLWVVTVAFAQTSVIAGNIKKFGGAPFIPIKLPQITFSHATTSGGMIHTFPDGIIDLSFTTLVNFSGAGYFGNTVTYPIAFPNGTFDIQVCYSGTTPPLGGVTFSAEPIDKNTCQITTNSTGFGVSGIVAMNVRVRGN